MSKDIRPANAGAVTRALVAAGFRKAEYHPSGMVKGYGTWTSGIKSEGVVERHRVRRQAGSYRDGSPKYRWYDNSAPTGVVMVEYVHGRGADNRTAEQRTERERAEMERAAEVLRGKGYEVETVDGLRGAMLRVSRVDADGNVVKF